MPHPPFRARQPGVGSFQVAVFWACSAPHPLFGLVSLGCARSRFAVLCCCLLGTIVPLTPFAGSLPWVWACSKAVLLLLLGPDIPLFSVFGRYPELGSLAWLAELEFPDFRCPAWDQHSHLPRPWWLWHWVPLFPGFRWSSLGSSSGKCLRWFPCLCVLNRCSLASVAFLGVSVCAGHTLAGLSPGAAASWLPVEFLGVQLWPLPSGTSTLRVFRRRTGDPVLL